MQSSMGFYRRCQQQRAGMRSGAVGATEEWLVSPQRGTAVPEVTACFGALEKECLVKRSGLDTCSAMLGGTS